MPRGSGCCTSQGLSRAGRSGWSDAFPGCAAVVFGHTHLPLVERHAGVWLLNPGSPTERRRGPFHSMLLLELDAGEIRPELVRLPEGSLTTEHVFV